MNQKIKNMKKDFTSDMKKGVKKYLKDLGLDMSKYKRCIRTDIRFIAVIDSTIIHISHDLTRHNVIVPENKEII